jgi:hypothetical protein
VQSFQRPIRIATFGPCAMTIAAEPWLKASTQPDPNHITIFQPKH